MISPNICTTLNEKNSLDIQDVDIKVYIFGISIKFRIDWYMICLILKQKVKTWLNTAGGYYRIFVDLFLQMVINSRK